MELVETKSNGFRDYFKQIINQIKDVSKLNEPKEIDINITNIIIKAINSEHSNLIIAPHLENSRYIKTETEDGLVFTIIKFGIAKVVNGSFEYVINLPDKCLKDIIINFNNRLERDIAGWEEIINEKSNKNLNNILNKI